MHSWQQFRRETWLLLRRARGRFASRPWRVEGQRPAAKGHGHKFCRLVHTLVLVGFSLLAQVV